MLLCFQNLFFGGKRRAGSVHKLEAYRNKECKELRKEMTKSIMIFRPWFAMMNAALVWSVLAGLGALAAGQDEAPFPGRSPLRGAGSIQAA